MKVKLLAFTGYNYYSTKDQKQKEGKVLHVCSLDDIRESDGQGNFKMGFITDTVFIRTGFPLDDATIVAMIGCEVDLVYERQLGESRERLVDIRLL